MSPSILVALLAGPILPLQAVFNARLGRVLDSPIWAASVYGAVTTIALVLLGFAALRAPPSITVRRRCPGDRGPKGSAASSRSSASPPRPFLGAVAMIAAIVFSQVVLSTLLDHFGLFGLLARHPPWHPAEALVPPRGSMAQGAMGRSR